jgi:dolichol kinase
MDAILHDTIVMSITLFYVFLVILIPRVLKDKGVISSFMARKTIHFFAGLAVLVTPYLYYPILSVFLAGAMTVMTYKSGEKTNITQLKKLYDAIGEEEEKKVGYLQGPFGYCLAITILVAIFLLAPDLYYFPIAAILIMIIADTGASIFGKKYGSHVINIKFTQSKRTVEGSACFFVLAFLCALFAYAVIGVFFPGFSHPLEMRTALMLSLITALVSMSLELVSPGKWDDMIVPIGTALIVYLIYLVF